MNMKTHIKIFASVLAAVAVMSLSSCSEEGFFDVKAPSAADESNVYSNYTLSEYADRRISMSDNAELTANLNTAIGNVNSAMMTEFHKINMDTVDMLDYAFSGVTDGAVKWMIQDLGGDDVVMSQSDAFKALVPQPDELIDDKNLDNVNFNMEIFKAFTKGYLESAKSFLLPIEIENLPYAAALFPYMQCVRFLADYINGDTYYKIQYPEHNLVRTKAQFKLLQSAEEQTAAMKDIIASCI